MTQSRSLAVPSPLYAVEEIDSAFRGWPRRIAARWRQSLDSIIETGRMIADAKADLPHGEFLGMVKTALPFGPRMAEMLMAIGADCRISNSKCVAILPPSVGTLYELTRLDDQHFDARLADGTIRPDLERSEAKAAVAQQRRAPEREAYQARVAAGCTLADLRALADSGARFRAINADPNWQYETYSAKGKDRSPDRHYRTDNLESIKALPVAQLAAENSVLHLWCMDWLLPAALEIIAEWKFNFIKVGFIWVKQNPGGDGLFMGLGRWQREGAELCLFATKGNPRRLNADVRQVCLAPVAEHSVKPDEIHSRIERLTAGPYLELFARRERAGWTTWGDEIPRDSFVAGWR